MTIIRIVLLKDQPGVRPIHEHNASSSARKKKRCFKDRQLQLLSAQRLPSAHAHVHLPQLGRLLGDQPRGVLLDGLPHDHDEGLRVVYRVRVAL